MTEKQLKELFDSLTLEQKVGQLFQCAGNAFIEDGAVTGITYLPWLNESYIKNCGSTLNVFDNTKLQKIQERHLKNNPVPLVFMADITNGYKVVFPSSMAQGCSFNPELTKRAAEIAAFEASKHGVSVTFSPMCDVSRDARWGRSSEGYGESALLNADFARANVEGYQGDDIGSGDNIASCVKHFAAYGAPYDGRDYAGCEMSERMLRTTYLPAYKAAVDAGVKLVMSAFNTVNGVPCTANPLLLKDILRDEWGFDGVVISDYGSVKGVYEEGAANTKIDTAKLCIEAGVDIDMVDNYYSDYLKEGVENGEIDEKHLNDAVMRVLRLKNELGILDDPYKFIKVPSEKIELNSEQHQEFTTDMVCQSSVLLKNENNTLPLKQNEKVAFIGPFVGVNELMTRCSMVTPHRDKGISIKESLNNKFGENKYPCEKGYPYMYDNAQGVPPDPSIGNEEALLKSAIETAKGAEKVVLCLGEYQCIFGEAHSLSDIRLPKAQRDLFDEIYKVNQNITVVLFNGRPLVLDDINDKANAILDVWFPGTYGANAIVDMLFGERVPSGKLSMCFPQNIGQVPIHHEVLKTNHYHPVGGKDIGYCCRYIDCTNLPLYPFGFGLSYTNFEYSKPVLSKDTMKADETITVSVDVTNTGDMDAYETVQLYLHDEQTTLISLPIKTFKAYKKVFLKKGETKTVCFEIDNEMLKFYDYNMNYISEKGLFTVFVGKDSQADNWAQFNLI